MKGRKPIVTVQFPEGGAKRLRDHFHRVEADSGRADDLHAALDAILADPKGTARGIVHKSPFKGRKPAKKPDDERGLKDEVNKIADAVFT